MKKSTRKWRRLIEEPTMSDKTLMLDVEDIISLTFGPLETNAVNFAMMQTVLTTLARQMRFLETDIEIKFDDDEDRIMTMKERLKEGKLHTPTDSESEELYVTKYSSKSLLTLGSEDYIGREHLSKGRKKGGSLETIKDVTSITSASESDGVTAGHKGKDGKSKRSGGSKTRDKGGVKQRIGKSKRATKSVIDSDETSSSERELKTGTKSEGYAGSKKRKGKIESPTASDDVSDEYHKRSKDKSKHRSRRGGTVEGSPVSGGSEDDSEVNIKKRKDRAKRGKPSGGSPTSTKSDYSGDKKSKKQSEMGDRTSKLGQTEHGNKRKGKKTRDKTGLMTKSGSYVSDSRSMVADIRVSEVSRKGGKGPKDTVLVVEKGPTTRDSRVRLGNIELVSRSQFELLKSEVKKLQKQSGMKEKLEMPVSQQLRANFAKGGASVPRAMDAMQLGARVKSAEDALTRMAEVLTRLAADGALSPDVTQLINQLQEEQRELEKLIGTAKVPKKGAKAAPHPASTPRKTMDTETHMATHEQHAGPGVARSRQAHQASTLSQPRQSRISTLTLELSSLLPAYPDNPWMTFSDLSYVVMNTRHSMLDQISTITSASSVTAQQAHNLTKTVADKLEIAVAIKSRIEELVKFTEEQLEILSGFDTGLTSQMLHFQDQLNFMRKDLMIGLNQFDRGDRVESTAVTSLRAYHDRLDLQLNQIMHQHAKLLITNKRMKDEQKEMLEWVDLLTEEKADRYEVSNGLRDKASIQKLEGLLHEDQFEVCRKMLCNRLKVCFETFDKHNKFWMECLQRIRKESQSKAVLMDLYAIRSIVSDHLAEIKTTIEKAEMMLGDPQLAVLTRRISRDAMCGSCLIPALMEPFDAAYGKPPLMPVLPILDAPVLVEEPVEILRPTDTRKHICKRWVGGSHTLITHHPEKPPAPLSQPAPQEVTAECYVIGTDGRTYLVEQELQACVECNQAVKDNPEEEQRSGSVSFGGGDQIEQPSEQNADQNKDLDTDQGAEKPLEDKH